MINRLAVPLVFCLMLLPLLSYQHANVAPEDDQIVKARAFLDALSRGDFEAATKDFDATMMKVSGPDKLAEFWKQVPERMGAFKRQTAARRDQFGGYEVALITCEFEKVTLDARVVFDKEKKIAGFQFVPALPPAGYEPPPYADPAKFEEREVTVGNDPWTLPATLAVPKGEGAFSGAGSRPRFRTQ